MAKQSLRTKKIAPEATTGISPVLVHTQDSSRLSRWMPWLFIAGGIIGLFASIVIMQDKIILLGNANFKPNCDLNPILSCGSVMKSSQAEAFGFANPFIGLIGFPVLITIGAAMLAGAQFKKWFWQGCGIGLWLGIVFAYWLLYESVYTIQSLCPYCLLIDVVLTTLTWYVTLYGLRKGWLRLPSRFDKAVAFTQRHHLDILIAWFLLIITVVLHRFWYYFGSLL